MLSVLRAWSPLRLWATCGKSSVSGYAPCSGQDHEHGKRILRSIPRLREVLRAILSTTTLQGTPVSPLPISTLVIWHPRGPMPVYQIDPLSDHRWAQFVQVHPRATIFHTPGWLETLRRTYGYECFGLTTTKPGAVELTNGMVFCRVLSWLTGARWVSVPFADHCDPLIDGSDDLAEVLDWVSHESSRARARYVEIRPLDGRMLPDHSAPFQRGAGFRLHQLDLRPSEEELFRSFDKHSVQRRIRKVENEGLVYEKGSSPELLRKFYQLMVLTRRRHRVPPQPMAWYRNLLAVLGEDATIRVASKDDVPIASIMTIRHGRSMIYKYGCSNERYNNLAGNPFLFWRAIRDAKDSGAQIFDMGRSDLDNLGLIKFKSNWGTVNSPLTYWRFPEMPPARATDRFKAREIGGYLLSRLPDRCLVAVGTLLYKHAG
jgi:Acetyltransferase (GNAT) domain